jgi:hypothetical protein
VGKANVQTEVFDTQGNGSAKVEVFKNNCVKLMKAIQFTKWAACEPATEPAAESADEPADEPADE